MKIVLANLPWKRGGSWGVRAGSRWPHIKSLQEKNYAPFPFFLAYAAALLKEDGFDVVLIDALAEEMSVPVFLDRIAREEPGLLVAETSTPSLSNDLEILKKLHPDLPIALCGPDATIREDSFLTQQQSVDYVMAGEYEMTLLDLAGRLREAEDICGVRGLVYRTASGIRSNLPRPLIEDLDSLPWPLRDGLPMEKYHDNPGGIPSPSVQMWTSRGCPYQCVFCAWPQLMYHKGRYRVRRVSSVVDEMGYLVRHHGFKSVYFDDDTTNIGKMRMMELAREIRNRDISVPWAMMARADLMDGEILESLRRAGLYAVKYGVESGVQNILDGSGKSMDLARTEEMIKLTKSLGIKTHLTFTFGLPGETRETVQKTIDFAVRADPDSLQFSITTPFPGTQYFLDLEEKGQIVSRNFSDYDGHAKSILRTDALTAGELEKAKKRAEAAWQRHIWQTRHEHVQWRGAGKRLARLWRDVGFWQGLRRAGSFAGYRLERLRLGLRDGNILVRRNAAKARNFWENNGPRATYKKIMSYYLDILGVYHGSFAFKGPATVQIDLTNNCNNNCIGCWCNSPLLGPRRYQGARKFKTLPTLLVKSLIDELAEMGTEELYFSGGGEPFMHPDILMILRYAKSKGLRCSVNTNFTLIDEAIVRQLVDVGLDGLTVSVWAGTARTYAATHPNKDEAAFYRLRNLLRMLNAMRQNGKPFVKVYHVLSSLNYEEIAPMVAFGRETESDAVEFTVIDTVPGATDALTLTPGQRRSVLEQCESIKNNDNGVRLLNIEHFTRRLADPGADLAQYDSQFIETIPCCIGWLFSRIMPNGDVNFCLKAHRIPVGNLYERPFKEIWNSQEQMQCRRKALTAAKDDPFFQSIGNDPDCLVGCRKSCDDLGRIIALHNRMNELTPFERSVLHTVVKSL